MRTALASLAFGCAAAVVIWLGIRPRPSLVTAQDGLSAWMVPCGPSGCEDACKRLCPAGYRVIREPGEVEVLASYDAGLESSGYREIRCEE